MVKLQCRYKTGSLSRLAAQVPPYSPAVALYSGNTFLICHTGDDEMIYCTLYDSAANANTGWQQVPGQAAHGAVSLANISVGTNFVFMTFLGTDNRFLGEYISNGEWVFTGQIAGMSGDSAPSIAYNSTTRVLWAVASVAGQPWASWQPFGASFWQPWFPVGSTGSTGTDTPYLAALPNGNMVMSAVDINHNIFFREFTSSMNPIIDWSRDSSGFQTLHPVFLTAFSGVVYALLIGLDQAIGWWKPVANK